MSSPTSDEWSRLDAIVGQALEFAPKDRYAFVKQECAGDATLFRKAAALLEACHASEDSLPETTAFLNWISGGSNDAFPTSPAGLFTVVREIGAGASGVVYLAIQASPERQVALKRLRPEIGWGNARDRFEQEAEVLARLRHPGIAQVYSAGVDHAGPYIAMEFIEGEPITAFASRRALSTAQRLELLALVGEALLHAHQQGVIHRDLKPSNILVTAEGQPKIVDFGVARLLDRNTTETHRTTEGQIIGTVGYMSPEQASGRADAADTRSDIYALGVIGYELLTSLLPIDTRDCTLHEALRRVRELPPKAFAPRLPARWRDAETVIFKALRKEPSDRYATAGELRADVLRVLTRLPITARGQSVTYIARRFIARNMAASIATSIAVASLLVGAVSTAVTNAKLSIRNEELVIERDRARVASISEAAARRRAEAALGFTRDLFSAASPYSLGHGAQVLDFLHNFESASLKLDSSDPSAPSLHLIAAEAFLATGDLISARKHVDAAQACAPSDGFGLREQAELLSAQITRASGDGYPMLAVRRRLLDTARNRYGSDHPECLQPAIDLLFAAQDCDLLPQYTDIARQYSEIADRWRPCDDDQRLALIALFEWAKREGRVDSELIAWHDHWLATVSSERSTAGTARAAAAGALCIALTQADDWRPLDQLEVLLTEEIATMGEENPAVLAMQSALGRLYLHRRDAARAAVHLSNAQFWLEKQLGATKPDSLRARYLLAEAKYQLGQFATAERLLQEGQLLATAGPGTSHPLTRQFEEAFSNIRAAVYEQDRRVLGLRMEIARLERERGMLDYEVLERFNELESLLNADQRYDESTDVGKELLDRICAKFGRRSHVAAGQMCTLAWTAYLGKFYDTGYSLAQQSADIYRALPPSPSTEDGLRLATQLQKLHAKLMEDDFTTARFDEFGRRQHSAEIEDPDEQSRPTSPPSDDLPGSPFP